MTDTAQPSPDALRALAGLYAEGRHRDAEAGARDLLAEFPDAVALYDVLAAACAGQGKMEAAVEACRAAIRLKPDHAEACNNMGTALQGLGRLDDAIAAYREAIRIAPGNAAAYSNLGSALRAAGDLDGAVANYRRAVTIAPRFAAAHGNLGVALREQGQIADAVDSARQAVALRPDWAEAHNNLGVALRAAGRAEDAAASYRRAVALRPDYAEAHNNLGNVLHDLGRFDEATEAYRAALRLRPDHASAAHMLAALTGTTTKGAPAEYTARLFDGYAPDFDRHLVKALHYEVPALLADLLRRTVGAERSFAGAIDLGCGTGLSGEAFRPFAKRLVGVDLADRMLRRARDKNIYDALSCADAVGALRSMGERYDLFVCTDVLIYVGDARDLMAAAAAAARPGAVFCVSTELHEGEGYVLRPSGRYAHSDAYMAAVAASTGFREIAREDAVIRVERSGPIPGRLYIFELGAAPS